MITSIGRGDSVLMRRRRRVYATSLTEVSWSRGQFFHASIRFRELPNMLIHSAAHAF